MVIALDSSNFNDDRSMESINFPGVDVPACRPWKRPRTGYCPCVPPARSLCPPRPDCSVSRVAL